MRRHATICRKNRSSTFARWWVMSSYLSKWDSNQRLEFEPQSHLNNPWPTSTVPFLRDFPNLRAMPQGLELLADSVLTPNYNVVRANPLCNLTPSTWNSLPDAWDYSARHGHQLSSICMNRKNISILQTMRVFSPECLAKWKTGVC